MRCHDTGVRGLFGSGSSWLVVAFPCSMFCAVRGVARPLLLSPCNTGDRYALAYHLSQNSKLFEYSGSTIKPGICR